MNAEQMQKWKVIKNKGRTAYLMKRTLLWGVIWSFVKIGHSELHSRLYARQIAKMTMEAIFGKDWKPSTESPTVYYITSYYGEVIACFLLAWFVALAVWTYKEQYYCAYITTKTNGY